LAFTLQNITTSSSTGCIWLWHTAPAAEWENTYLACKVTETPQALRHRLYEGLGARHSNVRSQRHHTSL